jgi:hypothetical protein
MCQTLEALNKLAFSAAKTFFGNQNEARSSCLKVLTTKYVLKGRGRKRYSCLCQKLLFLEYYLTSRLISMKKTLFVN